MTRGLRRLRVQVPAPPALDYEVVVGEGMLGDLSPWLERVGAANRVLVVTDSTVESHFGASVREQLEAADCESRFLVMAPGEAAKTRVTLAEFQDEAIAWGIDRHTVVLALGGGVPGDLAGYLAASLLRGLRWWLLPTSLLAMVDSAVGGKSGIDTPGGKNLVGAFWQPALVLADTTTLATLPADELAAGLAEVIKYGVILDEQLFTDLEDGLLESCTAKVQEALGLIVSRCVALKAEVVEADALETGQRQVLNFGHTVAHALEIATGYELRHGEAVAIGMVAEARLAAAAVGAPVDLAERIAGLCERAGLPVEVPAGLDHGALVRAARRDKKSRGGDLRCALPAHIGQMVREGDSWSIPVREEDFRQALAGPSA